MPPGNGGNDDAKITRREIDDLNAIVAAGAVGVFVAVGPAQMENGLLGDGDAEMEAVDGDVTRIWHRSAIVGIGCITKIKENADKDVERRFAAGGEGRSTAVSTVTELVVAVSIQPDAGSGHEDGPVGIHHGERNSGSSTSGASSEVSVTRREDGRIVDLDADVVELNDKPRQIGVRYGGLRFDEVAIAVGVGSDDVGIGHR